MAALLRPPAHRGPLIAAGAVLVTVAVFLIEGRFEGDWSKELLLLVDAAAAALVFGLGLQARTEGGRPPAYQSVLLVAGMALLVLTLFRLAEVLGSDGATEPGTLTWVFLTFGTIALYPAVRKASAICALAAALAYGAATITGWEWVFEPDSSTPFRWLLLLLAANYALISLVLRGGWPRHSEQMVNAAGIALLGIVAMAGIGFIIPFAGVEPLGGFWEFVLLAGGCGMIAYAAADRAPGPAYIGGALLFGFALIATGTESTLLWWPLLLLVLGLGVMAAGLRPRSPLPPEPAAYGASELPLAARTGEDPVIRVRDES